jgi:DNA-directed RNA polymerase sigma subunit (sigma70/sigma32)
MAIKMIVHDIYELEDSGAADKVERIEGIYDGKDFELDRVYSDYDEEDDTYGLIEVEWYEGDESLTDEEQEIIIERFWDFDYDEA